MWTPLYVLCYILARISIQITSKIPKFWKVSKTIGSQISLGLKKGQLQVKSSTEYLFKVIFELTHNKLGTVLKFHAISMKSSDQPK